jgi:hypothetical protein
MKTIDLSDLKAGDKAWSVQIGECRVTYIFENVLQCDGTHEYNVNGTFFEYDTHPTLFHSIEEFLEYWAIESNQPTRAQVAMAAMQAFVSLGTGIEKAAELAVKQADALLTKLNEKQ